MDDALRQWNLARTAFAASLHTYLDTFSRFELECNRFFDPNESGAIGPEVRASLDEELLSFATCESSIPPTKTKLLRLRNMTAPISPIRRLPADILAQVFILVVDWRRAYAAGPHERGLSIKQVNSLSSVCSYWRHVALGTGLLWSYLDLDRLHHTGYISLWLDRAGSSHLDVRSMDRFGHPRMDAVHVSKLCLVLPRIKCVRSMVMRSSKKPMERWLSEWRSGGVPRTLTTLALSTSHGGLAVFPTTGVVLDHRPLDELFHSLDTLYLDQIRVNWDSLRCRNLISLSLRQLSITMDNLGQLLAANPNLEYISLWLLDVTYDPTPTTLPLAELPSIHTLRLEGMEYDIICDVLAMIAPGHHGLDLKLGHTSCRDLSDASRQKFVAFCRRSHITTLRGFPSDMMQDLNATGCKIEVLCLENMTLSKYIYDFIVPPANIDAVTSSEHLESCLPHLRSLQIFNSTFTEPEDFRRIISVCSIREIGIDRRCGTYDKRFSEIEDVKEWAGPDMDVSFVFMENVKYEPFTGQ